MVPVDMDGVAEAFLVSVDGPHFLLRTSSPFAPGSPLAFDLSASGKVLALRGKCTGAKRFDEGFFSIRGRFINLTREDRELLAGAASDS